MVGVWHCALAIFIYIYCHGILWKGVLDCDGGIKQRTNLKTDVFVGDESWVRSWNWNKQCQGDKAYVGFQILLRKG